MPLLLFDSFDDDGDEAPPIPPPDNYKAKVMRRMLPPPFKRDFEAVIPTILRVIGQSDNLIGGLFGAADFLPDGE